MYFVILIIGEGRESNDTPFKWTWEFFPDALIPSPPSGALILPIHLERSRSRFFFESSGSWSFFFCHHRASQNSILKMHNHVYQKTMRVQCNIRNEVEEFPLNLCTPPVCKIPEEKLFWFFFAPNPRLWLPEHHRGATRDPRSFRRLRKKCSWYVWSNASSISLVVCCLMFFAIYVHVYTCCCRHHLWSGLLFLDHLFRTHKKSYTL